VTAESIFTLPKTERVIDGQVLRARAIERVAGFLARLPTDKAWRVSVREQRRQRTTAQNAYLHAVCYLTIANAIGYEPEEVAEYLCGTYFGWTD
jgi:hypothetical protein